MIIGDVNKRLMAMTVLDKYDEVSKHCAQASNSTIGDVNHTAKAKFIIAQTGIKYSTSAPKLALILVHSSTTLTRPCFVITRIREGKLRAKYAMTGEPIMNNMVPMISAKFSPTGIKCKLQQSSFSHISQVKSSTNIHTEQ